MEIRKRGHIDFTKTELFIFTYIVITLIHFLSWHFLLPSQTCRNPLEPNGYFSTINKIQNFYVLTPKRVYVFVRISEQAGNISKHDINWYVFIFHTESVYCEVRAQVRGENLPSCFNVFCMQNVWVGRGGTLSYCHAKVTFVPNIMAEYHLSARRD